MPDAPGSPAGGDRSGTSEVRRLDNVGIVTEDLEHAVEFFAALGLSLEGEADVSGAWVDEILGLDGADSRIALLATPDGAGKVELQQYRHPSALPAAQPVVPHRVGTHRLAFTVADIAATLNRLAALGHVARSAPVRYADVFLLALVDGPDGILVMLYQEL